MAGTKKTRTQLVTDVVAQITTNGNNEITGAQMRQILEDLLESAALLKNDAGLRPHDPTRSYDSGETSIEQGQIFQCNTDSTQGVFDLDKWDVLPLNDLLSNYDDWDNATTYQIDDTVTFNLKIYKSLSGGNQGNQPDISPANWVEISASTGNPGINTLVETVDTIQDNHQYFVFGDYTIAESGTLNVNAVGSLVIMDGELFDDGILNLIGDLIYVVN